MNSFKERPQIHPIPSLLLTTQGHMHRSIRVYPGEGGPGATSQRDQRGPDPIASTLPVVWFGFSPNPVSHNLISSVQMPLGQGAEEALWVGEHLTVMEVLSWDGMGRVVAQAQPSRMSLVSQV